MNNEEKILALLEKMTGQLSGIDQRMDNLEQGQSKLEQRMDGLEHNQVILEDKMDRRFEQVNAHLRPIWHDLDYALGRIDEHEKKYHSVG